MKSLVIVCLIASLATIAWSGSASWGRRNYTDYLLYKENVVRRAQKGNSWNVVVYYPKNGPYNKTISAVFVFDNFANNSGGYASLWAGGPGYKFVKLGLQSLPGSGMNMSVNVYGN